MWVFGGVEEENELGTREEGGGKGNRCSGGGLNQIGSKGETKREREGKRERKKDRERVKERERELEIYRQIDREKSKIERYKGRGRGSEKREVGRLNSQLKKLCMEARTI